MSYTLSIYIFWGLTLQNSVIPAVEGKSLTLQNTVIPAVKGKIS